MTVWKFLPPSTAVIIANTILIKKTILLLTFHFDTVSITLANGNENRKSKV